jgi:phage terminase small subunit
MKPLTQKQENFVLHYFEHGRACDAYRHAYSTKNMKEATVYNNAYMILQKSEIKARLQQLREKAQSDAVMTKQEALERLSATARVQITDIAEFQTASLGFDENNREILQSTWRIKDSDEMPKSALAAIKSVNATHGGTKLELHDPQAAIKQLADMLGWNAPVKTENEHVVKNDWHIHPTKPKE